MEPRVSGSKQAHVPVGAELAQILSKMRLLYFLCQVLRLGSMDLCAMTIFQMEPAELTRPPSLAYQQLLTDPILVAGSCPEPS